MDPRPPRLRSELGRLCRETRIELDITQAALAEAAGIDRGYLATIEAGQANATLDVVERVAHALGLDLRISASRVIVLGRPPRGDVVHARCSAYVERRLRSAGWLVAREVEVVHGRSHGWIDLLAFDPRTGTLLVIEITTELLDVGAVERQLGWYEREAMRLAATLGWAPRRQASWLLALASDAVDASVATNRAVIDLAFPVRAPAMLETASGSGPAAGRGLAQIDPASRRRHWLIRTRIDGRRGAAPYRDYRAAAMRPQP
jgi:transcriptional regulator with XRE-family HTH domain